MADKPPAPQLFLQVPSPQSGGLPSPESPDGSSIGVPLPAPVPNLAAVSDLLKGMRMTVAILSQTFESLQGQQAKVEQIGGSVDVAQQVHALRKQLVAQDRKQEERIIEVKNMIRKNLAEDIAAQLRDHIRLIVREKVTAKIRDQVSVQLRDQFPKGLAETLAEHREQLQLVKISLHNAEARRANGQIRSNYLGEPLTPVLKLDGRPSDRFPKNLAGIFALPDMGLQELMEDYSIQYIEADGRERNFNRLLQFLGIAFQMVPTPSRTSEIPLITRT